MKVEVSGSAVVVTGEEVVEVVLVVEVVDVVLVGLWSSVVSPPGHPAALKVRAPANAIRHDAPMILASRPGRGMVLVTVMPTPMEGLVALPIPGRQATPAVPRYG